MKVLTKVFLIVELVAAKMVNVGTYGVVVWKIEYLNSEREKKCFGIHVKVNLLRIFFVTDISVPTTELITFNGYLAILIHKCFVFIKFILTTKKLSHKFNHNIRHHSRRVAYKIPIISYLLALERAIFTSRRNYCRA